MNGVAADAEKLDSTGNVIGLPAARGVTIENSSEVTISNVEIHQFHKGIVLAKASKISILDNEIHDLRTSPIVGGGLNDIVIDGNKLSNSTPFRWGSVDHGDYIHIWTSTAVGQSKNITITNNVIQQGDGTALLGIYLDDNNNRLGFENVDISNNLIANGNHQGIRLENVFNSSISDNTLVQTSGNSKSGPGIVFAKESSGNVVSGNITAFVSIGSEVKNISQIDNIIVQKNSEYNPGYYVDTDVDHILGLGASEARAYIQEVVGGWTPLDLATRIVSKGHYESVNTDTPLKLNGTWDVDSLVVGGRGADTLTGRNGNDTLYGGDGNDMLSGGGGHDVLQGGAGADTFNFGADYATSGGFDIIADFSRAEGDKIRLHSLDANINTTANDSFDFIGGGAFTKVAGQLRYSVSDGNAIVEGDVNGDGVADFSIKLMGVTHLQSTDFIGVKALAKEPVTATPTTADAKAAGGLQAIPLDTLENLKVNGAWGKDSVVVGGRGADTLTGRNGNDTLIGGEGDDLFNGGQGDDVLEGGAGADTFNFAADYPFTGGVDTILDFSTAQGDKIRLHSIDANSNTSANEAFTFIGERAFGGAAGELRYSRDGADAIVQGDIDGDGVADFSIKLIGVGTLTSADFIL
ncbi:MAG: hypothetical protein ABS78_09685 [Phenylobacterium sp. SCN 70-31]|nr:MAG: hypothetical protein ABS78_09685 [Phenylobacterium sp. SCN 70-31]